MEIARLTDISDTPKILIQAAAKIYRLLSEAKALKILNQELFIKVPELIGEYSVAIQVQPNIPFGRKLRFSVPNVINVRARTLDDFSDETQAIRKQADDFELLIDEIRSESDRLLLTFEYRLKNDKFLNDLVHRDSQRDVSKSEGDIDEYWMHAQLKHPKILRSKYGRLDLRDIDFNVNVGIHQDLKTAISKDFIRNLQVVKEWIRSGDRTEKWRLGHRHLRLRSKPFTGKEDEILDELQKIFMPRGFRTFVDVTNPFRYYEAIPGVDFYDIPFCSFPKVMRVVSRTDLNLNNPAAKGKLLYKREDLKHKIEEIVGVPGEPERVRLPRTGKKVLKGRAVSREKAEVKSLSSVKSNIMKKLRQTIRAPPDRECEVSDALENLFSTLEHDFQRERVSFPYATKFYTPDFTFESLSIAMDTKLCKVPSDEKRVIDEINADIPAYRTKYKNLIFVVYDRGCIRDVRSFTEGIEKANENVSVIVTKH